MFFNKSEFEPVTKKKGGIIQAAVIGTLMVAAILIIGTYLTGRSASKDAEKAVRSVSLLYLDELAGRREQVIEATLDDYISDVDVAVGLLEKNDLASVENLQAYQSRMKQIYSLEKFAFVDKNGVIYTSRGTRHDIDQYDFDYKSISYPVVTIKNEGVNEKKIIIAIPLDHLDLCGNTLVACFMEMSMDHLLEDVSLQANNSTTFCNIYTEEGEALTNMVL